MSDPISMPGDASVNAKLKRPLRERLDGFRPRMPNPKNAHKHTIAQWLVLGFLFFACHDLRSAILGVAATWLGVPLPAVSAHEMHDATTLTTTTSQGISP